MASPSCLCCGSPRLSTIFRAQEVPINSCELVWDAERSLNYPRGDIELTYCSDCAMIANRAFDSRLVSYTESYESSQHFSATFCKFAEELATRLATDYQLHGKTIVEIGCDKADFLCQLCETAGAVGIGIDPAARAEYIRPSLASRVTIVAECFDPNLPLPGCDFICCRHTLEHVAAPLEFLVSMRQLAAAHDGAPIFIEVPDATRILHERAFWDVYYEHCNYFTPESLTSILQRAGFELVERWQAYDDQYLCITARPAAPSTMPRVLGALQRQAEQFRAEVATDVARWQARFKTWVNAGQRVAIWGASSKTVALASAMEALFQPSHVVDINQRKQGAYLPGTSLQVHAPESLRAEPPEIVVVMNPVYCHEIQSALDALGVRAKLFAIGGTEPPEAG